MVYEELVVEVGGLKHIQEIPTTQLVIIRLQLQSKDGAQRKSLGSIQVVCPTDDDIILVARPSGRFSVEPYD